MSLLDRLRGRPSVEYDAAYGTAEFDEDFPDSIRSRIFAILKKPVTYGVIVGALALASPVMVWKYGFVPTTMPTVVEYREGDGYPAGTTVVRSLRDMLKAEREHGWVPNDLLWPRIVLPYRRSFQVGEWNAWQLTTFILKTYLSRDGAAARVDPDLIKANAAVNISSDSWWLPSTEGQIDDAVSALDSYLARLSSKDESHRARFYDQPNNLRALIDLLVMELGGANAELVNNPDIGWGQGYRPFHYVKGKVYVIATILEATKLEFAETFKDKRGTFQQLDSSIGLLKQALAISPLFVSNGELGMKSDLADLANLLAPVTQNLVRLSQNLGGN